MKVKEYWDAQAQKHQDNPLATTGDVLAAELEIREILKYLQDGQKVLDIGCGNGYKDVEFCKQKNITLKGIDFSEEMIAIAKQHESDRLKFEQGDILILTEPDKYDIVITDRCLINLGSADEQVRAIDSIYKLLKPSGVYLMLECTKWGLANINKVRERFNLSPIEERWHNNYLNREVLQYAFLKFKPCEINSFNSTYFLISRTINALLGNQYDSEINQYAAQLPPLGDYAPLKLFVLKK